MTYMSINDTIERYIQNGQLFRYEPKFVPSNFKADREVLMSQEAYQQCPPSGAASAGNLRVANVRDAIQAFIEGDIVDEGIHLKLLKPISKNVWEIRVIAQPQCRLFGFFTQPDQFLVTHGVRRDQLNREGNFDREIGKCIEKRHRLFPDLPIYTGLQYQDYVTKNGVPE